MDEAVPRIRTPDQRIRVFVSSTLRELAEERRAVRDAIESMHLAPVMFELGARPHPPRALYRSYLAQSDVFLGIYGERYGWVAPGEEVSGLEDEYALSSGLPALVYIRNPAPDREPRLRALLDRIRADDRTSYRAFANPDELAALVRQDLAMLLADRFDAAAQRAGPDAGPPSAAGVPAPYTALIGRDAERAELLALLDRPDVRIATLVGDGGIGKSRLAIDVARAVADGGTRVAFAMLESIATADRVITVIARALGVRDTGDEPLEEKVITAVAGQRVLLVVDNLEHVLDAAPLLVRLIAAAPELTLLVTSRSPMRVRAEHQVRIGPLELPAEHAAPDAVRAADAARLFVERTRAVRPGFAVDDADADAIAAICRRLDGNPLAIELAAARMQWLTARELLERLDSALSLLVGGARDLPERQRTVRSTIQWSADLLDAEARAALGALAVPAGSVLVRTAERVLAAAGIAEPLERIAALADASLARQEERDGALMVALPSLVRDFARESGDAALREAATEAWIAHARRAAREAATTLRGPAQPQALQRLELEANLLGGAVRLLLDARRLEEAAELAWSLYLYLWIGGYLGLVREWMARLLELADRERIELDARSTAIALYYTHAVRFWQEPNADVLPGMRRSRASFLAAGDAAAAALAGVSIGLALIARGDRDGVAEAAAVIARSRDEFAALDDAWGEAMTLVVLGRIAMATGQLALALDRFERSLELASAQQEPLGAVIAHNHRGWARLLAGDVEGARADLAESLERSLAMRHDEGVAYGLEGFVGVRAAEGDAASAGALLGAAQALRRRKGLLNRSGFDFWMPAVARLREAGLGEALDAAIASGATRSVADVLPLAR